MKIEAIAFISGLLNLYAFSDCAHDLMYDRFFCCPYLGSLFGIDFFFELPLNAFYGCTL